MNDSYNSVSVRSTSTPSLVLDITNMPGANSWPITTYFYYILPVNGSTYNCQRSVALANLVYWANTAEDASNLAIIDYGKESLNEGFRDDGLTVFPQWRQ